ncbi:DUF6920 family protein [Tabrizicola sp. BL-A-41-H6]|uniref:DUF6920 family protein n=1 Tax=Tabrizicola sp. BL-A-41-H6 TaxID=3421107 RepID=UPI003D67CBB6
MVWLKWAIVGLAGLAAVWVVLGLVGLWRWQARTAGLVSALEGQRVAVGPAHYDPAMLAGLPAPVERFFRAALTPGQAMVRSVRMAHVGTFNMGSGVDTWKPFTSEQWVEVARPGFVWDGRIGIAPGMPVRVHDAYVAGEGVLVAAVLGLLPVAHMRGTRDLAEGELMRWLAEAAWYPTALLPGQGVDWTAVDDASARATVRDGGISVSLLFRFGAGGMIESVRAEARGRTVGDTVVPTPWEGRWSGYERRDGMMVPMAGEVAWVLAEGEKPYWRGRVTALAYAFSD